ncbi:hypothetical protein, partial [Actinoplanes sp. NPDC026623]|uniref:hypothetical protein n=1 Tax=Actinoplanes sp. NPDC026623 TaxID=3155610 RepID=UPI0034091855
MAAWAPVPGAGRHCRASVPCLGGILGSRPGAGRHCGAPGTHAGHLCRAPGTNGGRRRPGDAARAPGRVAR